MYTGRIGRGYFGGGGGGGGLRLAMQIYVKSLAGRIITLEVSGTDTIANIKEKITDKEGIPGGQQRLVYDEKQLEDDEKTLDDCGIRREATIYIVLKIPGGNNPKPLVLLF